MAYTKVVIIGGGFAGLNAARAFNHAKFDVLLIDKTNHHLFQPLLYEVATAALSPGQIATPLREILRHQENTTVIMGEVVKIDKTLKQITLSNGDVHGYDYLIVCIGARHSYFGREDWEFFAPGLKTIRDALNIREEVLISFEKAERLSSIDEEAKYLNFVIIGGGPTGVEMAGAIAEIANKTMFKNFRRIKPEESKIYLLEALPQILPMYPSKLSKRATEDLEKMGVKVLTGKKVIEINEKGVKTEDAFIESKNIIWAAGNQVSPMLKTLDVPLDRAGRVIVGPDLSIPDHPEVFVVGDAAHSVGKDGKPLPGVAPVAIQQGRYVAKIIKNATPIHRGIQNLANGKVSASDLQQAQLLAKQGLCKHKLDAASCKDEDADEASGQLLNHDVYKAARQPFVYFDKGSLATIGKAKAIAVIGKLQLSGFFAWLMWAFVHIMYLIGFRNRIGVMFQWAATMFTGERGVRLITRPIDQKVTKP